MTNEGKLWGHLLDAESVDAVLRALSDDAVVFAPLHEALRETWANMGARRAYEAVFAAGLQADAIDQARKQMVEAGDHLERRFGLKGPRVRSSGINLGEGDARNGVHSNGQLDLRPRPARPKAEISRGDALASDIGGFKALGAPSAEHEC